LPAVRLKRSSLTHRKPFAAYGDLQGCVRKQRIESIKSPRSSADSVTTLPGFRLSLHIGCRIPATLNLRLYEQTLRKLEKIGLWYSPINVWMQDVDCELFGCLPGADRTIGRSRAPHGA
jgi:hypothetical protein